LAHLSSFSFNFFGPYNVWMSREHGRSRACEAEATEGTGVALAQASDMTAARRRFNPRCYTAAHNATYGQLWKLH